MLQFVNRCRFAWYMLSFSYLSRKFTRNLGTVAVYCLIAAFFCIGYFLGISQNISACNKICLQELQRRGEIQLQGPIYQSFLVIIIFSAPRNRKQRDTIRETWLLPSKKNKILNFFVIGVASLDDQVLEDLSSESRSKQDLLLLKNCSDSYSKLSKKLLDTLLWIDNHANFTFLLKVDDDSFVRLDAILDLLKQKSHQRLYLGFFDGRAPVHRIGKWKEKNWNLCDTYLPYAKGGGYVLTSDLVTYVAKNSPMLKLYKSEDATVGAWFSGLDIHKVHDPNFDTEYRSRGCFNSYLVTHKQTETMMVTKYKNLITTGSMCSIEQRNRLSYIYNWTVLPSLCCIRNNSDVP